MRGLESELVLEEDDGSKFRGIVLNVESVRLALDDCMASTNTDIVDSHLRLVASSKFELALFRGNR